MLYLYQEFFIIWINYILARDFSLLLNSKENYMPPPPALFFTNIITLVCLIIVSLYYKIPKKIIKEIIEPSHGRNKFLKIINRNGSLLDVGCGNNSPYFFKTAFPNITYIGIDIGDYNQVKSNLADNYIVTSPKNFADKILELENKFDTVVSSHNLEHCNDRNKTLFAMAKVLKIGGYLYLSFPTEKSVKFPGPRKGTLNYYDDSTHKDLPPNFDETIEKLKTNGMKIIYSNKSYKPFFYYIYGMLLERKSKHKKQVYYPIWAYYGFETIIWAQKIK
jgi:SAM-dependent methyltransferase